MKNSKREVMLKSFQHLKLKCAFQKTLKQVQDDVKLIFLFFIFSFQLKAQTIKIISAEDKKPVPFAHVLITPLEGGYPQAGIEADADGVAFFRTYSTIRCKLDISYPGFKKLCDTVRLSHDYTFSLETDNHLKEVVVTGQYAPSEVDKATQRVEIIDSKKINAMAAVNLRDVLTNQLNIRLTQDNILGSSMDLQGISGQNVKILIDGVPIIGRQNGNIDLSQVNLNNIERIEIIQGPMSVSYGTNALAGTINLITKKNAEKHLESNISSYYESIGNYNLNGRLAFQKNKSALNLSGGRNYFDGWSPHEKFTFIPKSLPADSSRNHQWKPREQYFAEAQYLYKLKQMNLSYKGAWFDELITNKGIPLAPYGENAFDDYYRTRRIDNAVFANGNLGKNLYLNLQAACNDYRRIKNTYYKDLTDLHETLTTNEGDQDTTKDRLLSSRATISTKKDSSKINGELGYDINAESAYGSRIKNRFQQMGDYALFSSVEYKPVKKLTLRPGLRYAYNTLYKAPLVPSLNLRYELNATHTLRFSYARGFRAPSLQELYFYFVDVNHDIIGNPSLKAEQSHNFNLSVSYKGLKRNMRWRTDNSFFYNYIENLITLAQGSGTQYSYINVGIYQTLGVQLNTELSWQRFKISAGGSYTGRYNDISEQYKVKPFSFSPEARASLWYEMERSKVSFSVFYKYSGRLPGFMLDASNNVQQSFINDYSIMDATVSRPFFRNRIKLSAGSKNIFNVTNVRSNMAGSVHSGGGTSTPLACGRTYFIKLDINLHSSK